jgi:hypothetical protein
LIKNFIDFLKEGFYNIGMEKNCGRYNKLSEYLKSKFGEKALKICIDGGFSCPNRDGVKATGGCAFCSSKGSGEHIFRNDDDIFNNSNDISSIVDNIQLQIKNYFSSYKAQRANKFIAYFQNFTNTYDSIQNLKKRYDVALTDNRIVALAIATRPDCINEEIVKLISSYSSKLYVWVELGLQTSNEITGKQINRCYTNQDFSNAVKLLNKYNIDCVTHIMIGLPNENHLDLENTVDFINSHNIQGLKIHSTYVVENTGLAKLYEDKLYTPITLDYYIEQACFVLTHISPDIIIHKISGDAPKDILLAPAWNSHKKWIMNGIDKYLNENNLWQGKFYKKT